MFPPRAGLYPQRGREYFRRGRDYFRNAAENVSAAGGIISIIPQNASDFKPFIRPFVKKFAFSFPTDRFCLEKGIFDGIFCFRKEKCLT